MESSREPDTRRSRSAPEDREAERHSAAADPRADGLLALQAAAGNRAVASLLARQPPTAPAKAAPDLTKARARLEAFVILGNLGPNVVRDFDRDEQFAVLKEDSLVLTIRVTGIPNPRTSGLRFGYMVGSGLQADVKEAWDKDDVYAIEFRASGIGTHPIFVYGMDADGVAIPSMLYANSAKVLSDIADFETACGAAHVKINERFARATAKLNRAGEAYEHAFHLMESGLKEAQRREQLRTEVLLGLIFAAVGGFAGGATGAVAKSQIGKAWGDAAVKSVWGEGLTDTAKDTVKFAVRTSRRLLDAGGAKGAAGTEASGDALGAPAKAEPGKAEFDASRPLSLLTNMSARLAEEQADALKHLHGLLQRLRTAKGRDPNMTFDEDPTEYAEQDDLIKTIDEKTVTDWKVHLEDLWGAWLEENVVMLDVYLDMAEIRRTSLYEKFGKYLEEEVEKAAKLCGSSLDVWVARYLDPVRKKKRDEVKRIRDEEVAKHGRSLVDQGPIGAP